MTQILRAAKLFTSRREFSDAWVAISAGTIADVGSGAVLAPYASAPVTDLGDAILAPGYVDIHCHGGGGASFGGVGEQGLADAATIIAIHLRTGTTTMLASLVTNPIAQLAASVQSLAPLVADGTLAGVHLEGPWLSQAHKGAHDSQLLVAPRPQDIAQIFDAAPGTVKMVTIAPELEGGMAAVADVVSRGAVAAVGHTDADYDLAGKAIDAGATNVTHLFNGMSAIHHRAPGPIIKFLEDERVNVEIIADGVHSHPAMVAHAARAAGTDRVILVTDAMAATGMADGDYLLGALTVEVRGGVARLQTDGSEQGAIAGSTLTMERAVQFCVQEAGMELGAALAAATRVPAAALGRTDIGHLEPGATANLVVLNPDLSVAKVYRHGELVVIH